MRLRKIAAALGAVLPGLLRDTAGLLGAAAIAYGAWQIYPPLGFIAGGALLLAGAWLLARTDEPPAPANEER